MIFEENNISGKWAKASELGGVKRAKIVSEAKNQPSSFLDDKGNAKVQAVCKVLFEGNNEPLNVRLNPATKGGLIRAFGKDSVDWQNHYLSVETEKMRVAGKAVNVLYLVPQGFKKIDDENGYAVIVSEDNNEPVVSLDEEESKIEVPF